MSFLEETIEELNEEISDLRVEVQALRTIVTSAFQQAQSLAQMAKDDGCSLYVQGATIKLQDFLSRAIG